MAGEQRTDSLREIQLRQIEVIRVFTDICQKEHLTYYMLGGTMLGAVRHKGYIPWDDDVDMGLPRPDYEKFLLKAGKYLPEGYQIRTHQHKNHRCYIARLNNSQGKIHYCFTKKEQLEDIGIDVFPLDGMPNQLLQRKLHQMRLLTRRLLYAYAHFDEHVDLYKPHRIWYERFLIFLGVHLPIEHFLSKDKAWERLDCALKSCPYETSDYLVNMMGAYKFREMFPKTVFGKGKLYEFENMQLNGPQDYETYLTSLYGDYMTPPPVEERNRHRSKIYEEELQPHENVRGGVTLYVNFKRSDLKGTLYLREEVAA